MRTSGRAWGMIWAVAGLTTMGTAQQVRWVDNPLSGKVVGLTYGTSGWNAAEAQAVTFGGHLVTIRNEAENQWLKDTFAGQLNGSWIGYTDAGTEGQWRWSSGEPTTFTGWSFGEPDGGTNENWAQFQAGGYEEWNDLREPGPLRSLIEVPIRPGLSWSWPDRRATGLDPTSSVLADLDSDGDLDCAVASAGSRTVKVYDNDGLGGFTESASLDCGWVRLLRAADLDNDGDLDLIVSDADGWVLARRRLAGGEWGSRENLLSSPFSGGFDLGDLNGDGRLDIAVGSTGTDDKLRVGLQQPNGSFVVTQTLSSGFDDTYGATIADLDGDGHLDVIGSGGLGGIGPGLAIFRGSASGQVAAPIQLGVNGIVIKCTTADLDGDGDLDLLVPRRDTNRVEFWRNNGALQFSLQGHSPTGPQPYWVAMGDLDLDGRLDFVVATQSTATEVWRGTSSFNFHRDAIVSLGTTGHVTLGDVDGDGDLDVATTSQVFDAFDVVRNQQTALADCDGNGVPDAAELASGNASDCNSNGRIDSCDIAAGVAPDLNGNLVPDTCEPRIVSLTPDFAPSSVGATATLQLAGVPDGGVVLELGDLQLPTVVVSNAATVVVPPLSNPSATDVVASARIAYSTPSGTATTLELPNAFRWDVPRIVSVQPGSGPRSTATPVLVEVQDLLASTGYGTARFGEAPPQLAYFVVHAGQTKIVTLAPPQANSGSVPLLLTFGAETALLPHGFVYLPSEITSLSTSEGWQTGGTQLELDLYGFQPDQALEVSFGATTVTTTVTGDLLAGRASLVVPFLPESGQLDLRLSQSPPNGSARQVFLSSGWLSKPPTNSLALFGRGPQKGGGPELANVEGLDPLLPVEVVVAGQVAAGAFVGTQASGTVDFVLPPYTEPIQADTQVDVYMRQQGLNGAIAQSNAAPYVYEPPTIAQVLPNFVPLEGGSLVVLDVQGFRDGQPALIETGGFAVSGMVTTDPTTGVQQATFATMEAVASGAFDVRVSQDYLVASAPQSLQFDPPRIEAYCTPLQSSIGSLPHIDHLGPPASQVQDFRLVLADAVPRRLALYFSGATRNDFAPFYGGTLCVAQGVVRGPMVQTDAQGGARAPFVILPSMVGTKRCFQWLFRDPPAPASVGLSGGLEVEFY